MAGSRRVRSRRAVLALSAVLSGAGSLHAQNSGALTMVPVGRDAGADPVGAGAKISSFAGVRNGGRLVVDEAAIAGTAAVLGPGFVRIETTHFVILSDCPLEWTRARASLLERARHQFYRATERLFVKPVEHPGKLLCVLINDHARFREFGRTQDGLDAGWVAGYYSSKNNRIVFYNDAVSPEYAQVWSQLATYDAQVRDARARAVEARRADREETARRLELAADDLAERVERERDRLRKQADDFSTAKTIHEAVHLLAFNTGLQRRGVDYPFWLSEGLAASFETYDAGGAFGPDRDGADGRRQRYLELVNAGQAPPLAEIVMLSRSALLEADAADAMYAVSACLFTYLFQHDRAALSLYLKSLTAEQGRRLSPQQHLELFVRHFGDPRALERKMIQGLR